MEIEFKIMFCFYGLCITILLAKLIDSKDIKIHWRAFKRMFRKIK